MRKTLVAASLLTALISLSAKDASADVLSAPENHVIHVEQAATGPEDLQSKMQEFILSKQGAIESIRLIRGSDKAEASLTVTVDRKALDSVIDQIKALGGNIVGRESHFGSFSVEIETLESQINPLVISRDRLRQMASQGDASSRVVAEREIAETEGRLNALNAQIGALKIRQSLVSVEIRSHAAAPAKLVAPPVDPIRLATDPVAIEKEFRSGIASLLLTLAWASPWMFTLAVLFGGGKLFRSVFRAIRGGKRRPMNVQEPVSSPELQQ